MSGGVLFTPVLLEPELELFRLRRVTSKWNLTIKHGSDSQVGSTNFDANRKVR